MGFETGAVELGESSPRYSVITSTSSWHAISRGVSSIICACPSVSGLVLALRIFFEIVLENSTKAAPAAV